MRKTVVVGLRLTIPEQDLLAKLIEAQQVKARAAGLDYEVTGASLLRGLLRRAAEADGLVPELPSEVPEPSFVYFVQSTAPSGVIKIGSTTNLDVRLSQLNREHPVPLKVLHTMAGDALLERNIQLMFAHLRAGVDGRRSDWFHPDPELLAFIQSKKPSDMASIMIPPIKRPPPEPGPIDNEVEYNLAAAKEVVEPLAPAKKAPRKAAPSPPAPQAPAVVPRVQAEPGPPLTPVPAPLTTTSDDALAEIGIPPAPQEDPLPNPPTEDDEIAAMLDSV